MTLRQFCFYEGLVDGFIASQTPLFIFMYKF